MGLRVKENIWYIASVAACLLLLSACSSHTPAPVSSLNKDYSQVDRGSFRGSYYRVQKGDTLYFISYVTGKEVKEIIAQNKLSYPYTIYPGQKLDLWNSKYVAPKYGSATVIAVVKPPVKTTAKSKPAAQQNKTKPKPPAQQQKIEQKTANKKVEQDRTKEYSQKAIKSNNSLTKKPAVSNKVAGWNWPNNGRVIETFSNSENGNKGIDIAGQRGATVAASANGRVVYAGSALRGYGNLIIIKHSDDYLSAYAHNDKVLVKEQQTVKAGQKIASMGSSGTSSVRLHFEIRYKGKSVDPMRYLPKK